MMESSEMYDALAQQIKNLNLALKSQNTTIDSLMQRIDRQAEADATRFAALEAALAAVPRA
jgi:flagellar capping protein FliD